MANPKKKRPEKAAAGKSRLETSSEKRIAFGKRLEEDRVDALRKRNAKWKSMSEKEQVEEMGRILRKQFPEMPREESDGIINRMRRQLAEERERKGEK